MSKSTVLSSTVMNDQLKKKRYDEFNKYVFDHFTSNPMDATSAVKVLNALAFHLYHNEAKNEDVSHNFAKFAIIPALKAFLERTVHENTNKQEFEKVTSNLVNIIFRGLFKQGHLEPSLSVLTEWLKIVSRSSNNARLCLALEKIMEFLNIAKELLQLEELQFKKTFLTLCSENKIFTSDNELRLFYANSMLIDAKCFLLQRKFSQSRFNAFKAWIGNILSEHSECEGNAKGQVSNILNRIFLLIFRKAMVLKPQHYDKCLELLSFLDSQMSSIQFEPSWRLLSLYFTLYDMFLNIRKPESAQEAIQKLDRHLSKFNSAKASKDFSYHALCAFVSFCKWRKAYENLLDQVKKEVKESPLTTKTLSSQRNNPVTELVYAEGDSSPFSQYLKLELDESIFSQAENTVDILRKGLLVAESPSLDTLFLTSSYISDMILTCAEYFSLTGFPQDFRKCLLFLIELSRVLQDQNGVVSASVALLRVEDSPELIENIQQILNASNDVGNLERMQSQFLIALGWRLLHQNNISKAVEVAKSVLSRKSSKSSLSVEDSILKAEAYKILTVASAHLDVNGTKDDPINYSYEYYKVIKVVANTLETTEVRRARWICDMIPVSRCLLDALQVRLEFNSMAGLPLEMRLYGKLFYEASWNYGFSTRTAYALLQMANNDCLCDDPKEATVKLYGVHHILSSVLLQYGCKTSRNTNELGKTSCDSPELRKNDFPIPDFFQHASDCNCISCNHSLLALTLITFMNLQGVCSYWEHDSKLSKSFFTKANSMMKLWETKIQSRKDVPSFAAEEFYKIVFEALNWQGYCAAYSLDFEGCKRLVKQQRKALLDILTICQIYPSNQVKYYHQLEFFFNQWNTIKRVVKMDTLSTELDKLTLNQASPTLTRKEARKENLDALKTPMHGHSNKKEKEKLPERPKKRILRPRNQWLLAE